MECRTSCAACCIAPSIHTPLPGMPAGKPAGHACVNLDSESLRCKIWNQPNYPDLCRRFQAQKDICGEDRDQALQILLFLEEATSPTH